MTIHYVDTSRKHSIVIMDASDYDVVRNIIQIVRDHVKGDGRLCSIMPVDEDRLTMDAIEVYTSMTTFKELEDELSMFYPGLCVFDPPMAVF